MSRFSPRWLAGSSLLALAWIAHADARVLTLAHQTDTTAIVRDASDGNTAANALTSPLGKLYVEVGALAADADHDLVYAALFPDPTAAPPATPSSVIVGAYGSAPIPSGTLAAPAGYVFSALAFDAPGSRLVGIISDKTGASAAQLFTAGTSGGTAIGAPTFVSTAAGCCVFNAGVSAWRASTQDLFAIGRRVGDSEDQLLRFGVAGGSAMPDAYPIAGDHVVALAVDAQNGNLYALVRSALDFTYLARITWSTPGTPATLSAIGSAPAQCCYVATGPATIDGAGAARALYAFTRAADASTPLRLSRFDFVSGNPVVVNAASDGFGLWTDASASLDRIFANGFD
jgi:hypothetical protein